MTDTFFVGDNILYFYRPGGRLVDIHFYEIKYVKATNKNMAVVNSVYVPKNIYLKFINAMSMSRGYNGKFKYLIRMLCIFESLFKFIKLKLIFILQAFVWFFDQVVLFLLYYLQFFFEFGLLTHYTSHLKQLLIYIQYQQLY